MSCEKPSSSYCIMLYFWWDSMRNFKLITLGSKGVKESINETDLLCKVILLCFAPYFGPWLMSPKNWWNVITIICETRPVNYWLIIWVIYNTKIHQHPATQMEPDWLTKIWLCKIVRQNILAKRPCVRASRTSWCWAGDRIFFRLTLATVLGYKVRPYRQTQ